MTTHEPNDRPGRRDTTDENTGEHVEVERERETETETVTEVDETVGDPDASDASDQQDTDDRERGRDKGDA